MKSVAKQVLCSDRLANAKVVRWDAAETGDCVCYIKTKSVKKVGKEIVIYLVFNPLVKNPGKET